MQGHEYRQVDCPFLHPLCFWLQCRKSSDLPDDWVAATPPAAQLTEAEAVTPGSSRRRSKRICAGTSREHALQVDSSDSDEDALLEQWAYACRMSPLTLVSGGR